MPYLKRLACQLLIATLVFSAPRARASAYDAHPKLVILLVIDQFRADYLDRYRADFKGRGFRLFLDHGAYFEDCYYDYANTETAPGHATLGTGAYTDGHGISSNQWWDLARNTQRQVSSVEDERYSLIGLPKDSKPAPGASPRNLRASTIGDSLRLATQGQASVYGISLKDRAAILPAGFSANAAYWIDPASGDFISSSYYMQALPAWVNDFNTSGRIDQARSEASSPTAGSFYDTVGPTPAANAYELDFARALIANEQLGKHTATDMLTLSLSANDLLGHRVGPDSADEKDMVDTLDQQLDGFFTWLDKNVPGGLPEVWIAFSADHGIAPVPAQAAALGIPAATIDIPKLIAGINGALNAKFSPGEKISYILPQQQLPYISLNRPSFEAEGLNEQEAEQAVQQDIDGAVAALAPAAGAALSITPPAPPTLAPVAPSPESRRFRKPPAGAATDAETETPPPAPAPPPVRLVPTPVIVHSYTRQQLASGALPPSEWGLQLAHSYSPNGGWYVMLVPAAYQMQLLKQGTTHFSPWSYDRHVPLGFYGAPFVPGIYHTRVEPIDLAATLASLLGVNQPSASIGHVLTQAIHALPPPAPARPVVRIRRRSSSSSSPEDQPAKTMRHATESPKTTKSPEPPAQTPPAQTPQPPAPQTQTPQPQTPQAQTPQ